MAPKKANNAATRCASWYPDFYILRLSNPIRTDTAVNSKASESGTPSIDKLQKIKNRFVNFEVAQLLYLPSIRS